MRARSLGITALGLLVALVLVPKLAASAEAKPEEYAVYMAVLSARWSGEDKPPFVVQAETTDDAMKNSFDQISEYIRKEIKEQDPSISLTDALESFRNVRNSVAHLDADKLGIPEAKVVPAAELDAGVFDSSARFRERFDGAWGIIRLSRVAFSSNRSHALLAVSEVCGPLSGRGYYVVLEKKSEMWREVGRVPGWIR